MNIKDISFIDWGILILIAINTTFLGLGFSQQRRVLNVISAQTEIQHQNALDFKEHYKADLNTFLGIDTKIILIQNSLDDIRNEIKPSTNNQNINK